VPSYTMLKCSHRFSVHCESVKFSIYVLFRFTNKKVPYCVKFNPDADKQDLFVAGTNDKKIVCVSSLGCSLVV